ncbi:MAG: hypothetical protein K6G19_05045, partial [Lachnospiraceae bacterium]|nr:hypothetical protein [Lachnospiraceae bacterium]
YIQLLNLLMMCIIPVPAYALANRKCKLVRRMLIVVSLSLFICSLVYGLMIQRSVNKSNKEFVAYASSEDLSAEIPFSREGKNVVVIMLDRFVGAYVPFIMDEKPELMDKFAGFTFYPNTVSPGFYTNFGAPSLYGGYEYTPEAMNARDNMRLADKNDEALRVMPVIFDKAGYEVNVADLPYIHYDEPGDPLFDDYSEIVYHEFSGNLPYSFDETSYRKTRERRFIFYGLMKLAPATFQDEIYDKGKYLSGIRVMDCGGIAFYDAYTVLDQLDELCYPVDEGNCFFMLCNNTPHETALLSLPNYEVTSPDSEALIAAALEKRTVGGRTICFDTNNIEYSMGSYHAAMITCIKLGEWFDTLRNFGVYDNTRIILVADHGRELNHFEDLVMDNGVDAEGANALLMVKDFGSDEFMVDNTFMTNADTPALATEGIIEGTVVNPFTGNIINMDGKKNGILVLHSDIYDVSENNGNTFISSDNRWFRVKDNFADEENWEELP